MASWFDAQGVQAPTTGMAPGPSTQQATADQYPSGVYYDPTQQVPGGAYGQQYAAPGQSLALGASNNTAPVQVAGQTTSSNGSSSNPFSKSSTADDLITALNKAGATPGSDQATAITKQYTDALGNGGQALQDGFTVGQYDPTRSKIYLPGTDLAYSNGQWGSHPYSASDSSTPTSAGSPNPLNPAPFSYQPFTDQFSNPNFVAPTGLTEQNDPGFQQRLALGAQQLQSSAAGKGTLLSGQTANDLNQYAQNFATNDFSNVYNQALTGYQQNSQNNFQQYTQKYQQYLNGYQQALQGYNTNLGAGQQAFSDTLGLSSQNFSQNQQNWTNQFNTAQLGLNAANASANAGSQLSSQAGGYLTGAGNANSAGIVGSANAVNYGVGGATNALGALAANPYFQSPYGSSSTQPNYTLQGPYQ